MVNIVDNELSRVVFMQWIFRVIFREYFFFARRVAQSKRGLEGTKHQKSLANTAITKDLVQPKRIYGGLDAHLALGVIPCKMRPVTAWNMTLDNNSRAISESIMASNASSSTTNTLPNSSVNLTQGSCHFDHPNSLKLRGNDMSRRLSWSS